MKIRNGFVSNSSSSSFMLVMNREYFSEVYNNAEEYQKQMISHLDVHEDILNGKDMVYICGFFGNNDSFEDFAFTCELSKEIEEILDNTCLWTLFDDFIKTLDSKRINDINVNF